jgi:hypothetical protein
MKPGLAGKDEGRAKGDSPGREYLPGLFPHRPIGVFIGDDADPGTGIIGTDDTGKFLQDILFQPKRLGLRGGL